MDTQENLIGVEKLSEEVRGKVNVILEIYLGHKGLLGQRKDKGNFIDKRTGKKQPGSEQSYPQFEVYR